MALLLCRGTASAETYVSITQLQKQAADGWDRGQVVIPAVERVPVLTIQSREPLRLTVGDFNDVQSGAFIRSARFGKTPSHTVLENGLTLAQAQSTLNEELNRLTGTGLENYGLIWTEITRWKCMETWLLYYGQKFFGLTAFDSSAALTMDIRTPEYHFLVLSRAEPGEILLEDVPLLPWPAIRQGVEACLEIHQDCTVDSLELGYLLDAGPEGLLVPVWQLGLMTPGGWKKIFFSAQTGEEVHWRGNRYVLPEPFGWDAIQ